MKLSKNLSDIKILAKYSILHAASNFVFLILAARLLSPFEIGIYVFTLSIITFIQIIPQMGISSAIIQLPHINKNTLTTSHLSIIIFYIFGGLILCCIGIIYHLISDIDVRDNLNYLIIAAILYTASLTYALGDFSQSIINRNLTFQDPAKVNFVSFILGHMLVSTCFMLMGFGANALALGYLSAALVRLVFLNRMLDIELDGTFSTQELKRVMSFGVGFTVAKIGNSVALNADNIIIGSYLGASSTGLYNRAYQLVMSPITIFNSVVDRFLFAKIARKQHDLHKIIDIFLVAHGVSVTLVTIFSGLLIHYCDKIVQLAFGSAWMESAQVIAILALALPFRISYRFSDIMSRSIGLVKARAVIQWLYAIILISLCIYGLNWNITGIAYAVVSAIIINCFAMGCVICFNIQVKLQKILESCLPSVYIACVLFLVFEQDIIQNFSLKITLYLIIICLSIPFFRLLLSWLELLKGYLVK